MKLPSAAASLVGAAALGALAVVNRQKDYQISELRDRIDALSAAVDSLASRDGGSPQSAPKLAPTSGSEGGRRSAGKAAPSRELQPSGAGCPSCVTYASDHGAVGDSVTDDTSALQSAIDAAAATASNSGTGGTVVLGPGTYFITSPLIVLGGVTIKGQGYGSSPLAIQFDAGGSVIAYCGEDYAVKLEGHGASLMDLAVYDWRYPAGSYCDTVKAAGGVLVDADGELVESVRMSSVLLYWFMGGTALTLSARNGGGIAYGSFDNLRVRHARVGIHLVAEDGSFTNSNKFFNSAISGEMTDVALLAEGPGACNDNQFWGAVVEPPETSVAHVHVRGGKTNVQLHGVRLEGTGMATPSDGSGRPRPMVIIDDDSYGNVMNGMLGHTHIQADLNRNPGVDFLSAKSVGIDPAPLNLFENAAFHGFDGTTLPGWNLPGSNREITKLDIASERLYPDHNVLRVNYLNYGGPFKLSPVELPKSSIHSSCTFGIYARSSVAGIIVATMRHASGSMISSASHSGSGEWEFISMSALMDRGSQGPRPTFYITGDVDVTAPTFAYGSTPATPGASLMSASGAVMSGTLTSGMATVGPPPSSAPYYWTLPKEGNLFRMDMGGDQGRTINRINHGSDRFKKGTVVTLLFLEAGTTVRHSAYINLKGNGDFVVTVPNSSLTLVSNGDPTWTEVSRNG